MQMWLLTTVFSSMRLLLTFPGHPGVQRELLSGSESHGAAGRLEPHLGFAKTMSVGLSTSQSRPESRSLTCNKGRLLPTWCTIGRLTDKAGEHLPNARHAAGAQHTVGTPEFCKCLFSVHSRGRSQGRL